MNTNKISKSISNLKGQVAQFNQKAITGGEYAILAAVPPPPTTSRVSTGLKVGSASDN